MLNCSGKVEVDGTQALGVSGFRRLRLYGWSQLREGGPGTHEALSSGLRTHMVHKWLLSIVSKG